MPSTSQLLGQLRRGSDRGHDCSGQVLGGHRRQAPALDGRDIRRVPPRPQINMPAWVFCTGWMLIWRSGCRRGRRGDARRPIDHRQIPWGLLVRGQARKKTRKKLFFVFVTFRAPALRFCVSPGCSCGHRAFGRVQADIFVRGHASRPPRRQWGAGYAGVLAELPLEADHGGLRGCVATALLATALIPVPLACQ